MALKFFIWLVSLYWEGDSNWMEIRISIKYTMIPPQLVVSMLWFLKPSRKKKNLQSSNNQNIWVIQHLKQNHRDQHSKSYEANKG